MSSIVRAISPEVPEPLPGTWSNCLVVGGVAYLAGMTARGDGDEYAQAKAILPRSAIWSRRPAAAWPTSSR